MTREAFKELVQSGTVLLDGATGSNLRAAGMPVGVCAEAWVLEHPDIMTALQSAYVEAGSRIIYAPTFGANTYNLSMYGLEDRAEEMNHALVALARSAADGRALVAGDITTTGKPVDDTNGIGYDALYGIYRTQAQSLYDAGVDLFTVETMLGVTECSAAIEAIRSVCDLPVMCTLSLDATGHAYFDGGAEEAAEQLPLLGADAIGVNCGQGPDLYENIITRMAQTSTVPVIAKPNAGLPQIMPDGSAVYSLSPTRFARGMQALVKSGAKIIGGCCGTTPEHIRALKQLCL